MLDKETFQWLFEVHYFMLVIIGILGFRLIDNVKLSVPYFKFVLFTFLVVFRAEVVLIDHLVCVLILNLNIRCFTLNLTKLRRKNVVEVAGKLRVALEWLEQLQSVLYDAHASHDVIAIGENNEQHKYGKYTRLSICILDASSVP